MAENTPVDANEHDGAANKKPPIPKNFDPRQPDPQDIAGVEWSSREAARTIQPGAKFIR